MPAVRASAWRCPTIWMPTGIPSIASIGTVTAGAPRIEVGLLNTESPVLPRPCGAGPGELTLISASANGAIAASRFLASSRCNSRKR
jgi:hypothetical protein